MAPSETSSNQQKPQNVNQQLYLAIGLFSCLGLVLCIAVTMLFFGFSQILKQAQKHVPFVTTNIPESVTNEPRQTSTPLIHDTNLPEEKWPLLLFDSFDTNKNDWLVFSETPEQRSIQNGKFIWEVKSEPGSLGAGYPLWPPTINELSDFYAAVEVKVTTQPKGVVYGMMFRYNPDGYYYFGLNDKGSITVVKIIYNQEIQTLIKPTETSNFQLSTTNRLSVTATGNHFKFYINNQLFNELDDNSFEDGLVGIYMNLDSGEAFAKIEFDNFELHTPDSVNVPVNP